MMKSAAIHFNFLIFLFSIVTYSSCKTAKTNNELKPIELKHWLSLNKYPCFGHCMVYKLNIYRNGLVLLEGKEYMEKTGVYFTELSKDKMDKFKRLSDTKKWDSYESEYMVNIADLPVTEFLYYDIHGARIKKIKSNSNLPDPIHSLTKDISALITSEKWTQIQRKNDMTNPEIITNEFVIDMDSTNTAPALESEFINYNLKAITKLSNNMNLWNFQYDENKIGKYELLVLLRKKSGIRSVNFNRKILPREE